MDGIVYADISAWQPATIDWQAYKQWSSIVALRSSYGVGFEDAHYKAYRSGAEAAGLRILHYHYSYPGINSAVDEANWQQHVVGPIGANDLLMLDYEENNARANAAWAIAWLTQQEANYGKLPLIYASDSYVRSRLTDARLVKYPLVLADWQYTPNERPACPPPWKNYIAVQYTDKQTNVPGIAGAIDANVWLGDTPEEDIMIDINTPGISEHFTQTDENHWQSKKTGKVLQYAMLNNYKQEGNRGLCGWDELGDVLSNEIELPAPYHPGSVVQFYTCGVRMWNAATGKVTPVPLYDGGIGQDPLIKQLETTITQLQSDQTDAAKLAQIKAIVG